MYWGNSGFELGGFDIWGRFNTRGKYYVCANVYVCGYGYGSSREHQRPQRSRKRAPIVLMMLPYVVRARARARFCTMDCDCILTRIKNAYVFVVISYMFM